MRAVVWHASEDVRVEEVSDPIVKEPTDAILRVTATAICGSDLHAYRRLVPGVEPGDILGHEPMGVVEEVGPEVTRIVPGDRVVVPAVIACGACRPCRRGYSSQCEVTQVAEHRRGAAMFGYGHRYGGVPGGQAEYLRVPQAHVGPIPVPDGPAGTRYLLLSDVLPAAWQAVDYAGVPPGGSLAVWGLGPVGQMVARIALHRGAGLVIGVDRVAERLELAGRHGVRTVDARDGDPVEAVRDLTGGHGVDAAVDAVGVQADDPGAGRSPPPAQQRRPGQAALRQCVGAVRRGGVLQITGDYLGPVCAFPLGELFDKQLTVRMGQVNPHRWVDDILPLLGDGDPLGTEDLVTHCFALDRAPEAYELFQNRQDAAVKVILAP